MNVQVHAIWSYKNWFFFYACWFVNILFTTLLSRWHHVCYCITLPVCIYTYSLYLCVYVVAVLSLYTWYFRTGSVFASCTLYICPVFKNIVHIKIRGLLAAGWHIMADQYDFTRVYTTDKIKYVNDCVNH